MDKKRHPLQENTWFEETDLATWKGFFEQHLKAVFPNGALFDYRAVRSPEAQARINELGKPFLQLWQKFFFIGHGDECIGWAILRQTAPETVYMENTGLLPAWQGQGIYSAFLRHLLVFLRAEGFERVTSCHAATNNAILVPKLRQGFVISGMEISDRFGGIVHLVHHFSEDRQRVLAFRAGEKRLPRRLAPYIDMWEEEESE